MGGVQGATDERVCDVGRPAGPMNHWQKEREMIHTPNNPDRSGHKSCAIDNEGYMSIPIFTLVFLLITDSCIFVFGHNPPIFKM